MKNNGPVLIIGGANYDITAEIYGDTVPADSNPGKIHGSCGGVGRNIAENLARLGVRTSFMTVWGQDGFSDLLKQSCREVGMEFDHCCEVPGCGSCIYLSIMNRQGELELAAADMTALDLLPMEFLESQRDYIGSFPIVMLDANGSAEQLLLLADMVKGKLCAEGVSEKKVAKLIPIVDRLHTVKLNAGELGVLSGMPVDSGDKASVLQAAEHLIARGTRRVIATLGMQGSLLLTEDETVWCPAFPARVENVNGAGDAFAAAAIYGDLQGLPPEELLMLGTAAAHMALASPSAVSSRMSEENLLSQVRALSGRVGCGA